MASRAPERDTRRQQQPGPPRDLSLTRAVFAIAVDDDFVPLHAKTIRQQAGDAAQAAREVKKPLAALAQEEMMMTARSRFIVRLHTRDVDVPHLAFRDHLLERPVHRGDADALHGLPRLLANVHGRKRSIRGYDHLPDSVALAGFVGHDGISVDGN